MDEPVAVANVDKAGPAAIGDEDPVAIEESEHREVGVKLDTLKPTHSERGRGTTCSASTRGVTNYVLGNRMRRERLCVV